jgi:hypothetical protein
MSSPPVGQVTNCDSTTNWSFSYCSYSINTQDKVEGSGSINITGNTNWNAYPMFNPSGTWNWSSYHTLKLWVKAQDATKTANLYLYTDWSNYNVYQFNSQLSNNNWVEVTINLGSPTSTAGSVNFNSIDFLRFELENAKSNINWFIDNIRIS